MRIHLLAAFSLFLSSSGPTLAEPTTVEGICAEISELKAHALHVDRHDNLWLWNQQSSEVWQVQDDLGHGDPIKVPEAREVAIESDWGIGVLDVHGQNLKIQSFDTAATRVFPLPNPATALTWIDERTLALTTPNTGHLIEIWDIRTGEMVRTIGEGEPTLPVIGAKFLRSLRLAHSHQNEQIHTLESVTGDVRIFDSQGNQIRQSQIPAHRLPGLQKWLKQVDQQAQEENRTITPFFTVLRLAVTPDGMEAVLEQCSDDRRQATLTNLYPDGRLERHHIVLNGPFCSLNFTLWKQKLAFVAPDINTHNGAAVILCTVLRTPKKP
jgi:WD40 repeat protein